MEKTMRQKSQRRSSIERRRQRGAALILVVVVIMVLTVLGMAMVAFTTTEERSATAYRDTLQVRAVAEAGVRIVQMMFADPNERRLVPVYGASATADPTNYDYYGIGDGNITTQMNAIGIFRTQRPFLNPNLYSGNNNRLFSAPFGGANGWASAFGGTYSAVAANDFYDLRFRRLTDLADPSTVIANNWLDANINNLLVPAGTDANLESGRIVDISFYRPPQAEGSNWGICTVRVTAQKWVGTELYAQETIVAIIGDNNPRPAVLGNGNIVFMTQGGVMCGNGCEQIHANGTAQVGDISGGQDPMVTATGTITGGSNSTQPNAAAVIAPEINPWDLAYRPTAVSELDKYYLLTTRELDAEWTDGNLNTPVDKGGRPCGVATTGVLLSRCQDYYLEYAADGTEKPARAATDTPRMYKWDVANQEWTATGCTTGTTLNCGAGTPTFTATPADDVISGSATGETNNIPFHPRRVPRANFQIDSAQDGATVLVNGMFQKHGAFNAIMSIIAVGSMRFHSNTTWYPAMANRTMWVTGRDIDVQSNCCTPSNTCSVNLANNAAQSIVAAHEQIFSQSQTALAGIVIGENRVNFDNIVALATAIDIQRGDHAYTCGLPDWPWEMPTKPVIFAMSSASD
jgi:hypothetical protein